MDPAKFSLPKNPKSKNPDLLWNSLTVLMLVIVGCIVLFSLLVFINPNMGINPLKPPEVPATLAIPTSTPTYKPFPPTWTPTASPQPSATATPEPPKATATATVVILSSKDMTATAAVEKTKEALKESAGGFQFAIVQPIQAVASTTLYPEKECKWAGIGGTVMDIEGAPLVQQLIQLGGEFGSTDLSTMTALSGSQSNYGEAGFEFILGDKPVDSSDKLWIQLVTMDNQPLSEKIYLDTFKDCKKNMLLVNFRQVE